MHGLASSRLTSQDTIRADGEALLQNDRPAGHHVLEVDRHRLILRYLPVIRRVRQRTEENGTGAMGP